MSASYPGSTGIRHARWVATVLVAGLAVPGVGCAADTQNAAGGRGEAVTFSAKVEPAQAAPGQTVTLRVTAEIKSPWHIYATTQKPPPIATKIELKEPKIFDALGTGFQGPKPASQEDSAFGIVVEYHEGKVSWARQLKIKSDAARGMQPISVSVRYQACTANNCLPPKTVQLTAPVEIKGEPVRSGPADAGNGEAAASQGPSPGAEGRSGHGSAEASGIVGAVAGDAVSAGRGAAGMSLFTLLATAVGAGLLSILTPCVFPMVPITVGFFLKQSEAQHKSKLLLAGTYAGTIVVVFTVLGLVLGEPLRRLGASPVANLVIGVALIAFSLMFFGVFELRVPMRLLNFTASHEAQGGLVGVVFMALTLVVMSTPCIGPFVGVLLTLSSSSEKVLWSAIGLFTYAVAFASPFFVLAVAPGVLGSVPKGGGWMTSVKVVTGFVVFGLAFYFLAKMDQTWRLGVFNRSTVLSVWAVVSAVAGMYLLGKVHLAHDAKLEGIGGLRLLLALAALSFAVYLGAGLLGSPLHPKIVAGLPAGESTSLTRSANGQRERLDWIGEYEQAVATAKAERRPIFIDFTGQSCAVCKEMEAGVFPQPAVVERFKQMVRAKLYTDRDTAEDNSNARLQKQLVGIETVPYYVIVNASGTKLAEHAGKASEAEFVAFLDRGLERWAASSLPPGGLATAAP